VIGAGQKEQTMQRLKDKVAIVTGAASGIGRATVVRLAAEGAAVVVADINGDGAADVARRLEADGARATATQVDLASPDSIKAMVDATVAAFGGLDVLHNNAAATGPEAIGSDGGVVDVDLDVWDLTMTVNLRGTLLACKHAIPAMIERGGGSIINMSTNGAYAADVARVAYGVSKGGINALTLYVATLYGAHGIRCNAISPGLVMTEAADRTLPPPVRDIFNANHLTTELCQPEDIASAVAFLASDDARQMTGATLRVDGGMMAHLPMHAQMTELMAQLSASS
jgi:NAD(P)-dependent dehydrogenase (short-subunit alcohol dehydrogenase family)